MATGHINQRLRMSALPADLTFTVTALENNRRGSWYSYFNLRDDRVPFKAAAGNLVVSTLSTTSVLDHGPGLSNTLRFTVEAKIQGRNVKKAGYFVFATTDWPRIGRPDYTTLLFELDGQQAASITQQVPTLITPDPYCCTFAVKDNKLYMLVSNDENLSTTTIGMVIDGLLSVHTKALSWIVFAL